jgi:hypothetical protein
VKKPISTQPASGIVLFYPGRLLMNQIYDWADAHGGCRALVSFERSLPGIRKAARRAEYAVIDATSDPAQGADAFLQSVGVLKSDSVAVYTEKTHEGLELMVRTFGAPLLLGPMNMEEWEELLEHKFPTLIHLEAGEFAAHHGKKIISPDLEIYTGEEVLYYRPNAG